MGLCKLTSLVTLQLVWPGGKVNSLVISCWSSFFVILDICTWTMIGRKRKSCRRGSSGASEVLVMYSQSCQRFQMYRKVDKFDFCFVIISL